MPGVPGFSEILADLHDEQSLLESRLLWPRIDVILHLDNALSDDLYDSPGTSFTSFVIREHRRLVEGVVGVQDLSTELKRRSRLIVHRIHTSSVCASRRGICAYIVLKGGMAPLLEKRIVLMMESL